MEDNRFFELVLKQFATPNGVHDFVNRMLGAILVLLLVLFFVDENMIWLLVLLTLGLIVFIMVSQKTYLLWLRLNKKKIPKHMRIKIPARYVRSFVLILLILAVWFYE
jgi:hypothetical protein